DMYTWLWASKESRDYYALTGENTLWANNMFGGMPQITIDFYPETNWYHKLHNFIQFYTHGEPNNPAIFFLLAMLSFYLLSCVMRVPRWIGFIGSLAFAFSSYNPIIITAGHTTKMLDIGYIPAILAGIMLAYRGKYWQGAAISGLVLSFFFDSGHFQIIYYTVLVIGVLVIAYLIEALKNKRLKNWVFASATLALGASFAMMTNASKIMM